MSGSCTACSSWRPITLVAVVEGHVAAARRLVELGADVNCSRVLVTKYGGPPIYEAASRSDYAMMSMPIPRRRR